MNGPQAEALSLIEPGATVVLPWGRGVGKSHLLRLAMWLLLAEWDGVIRSNALRPFTGIRLVWLMPTLKQFRQVHGTLLESELNGEWKWLGAKLDHTTWRITLPGGSWVQPFPAVEYRSQTARGLRVDGVLPDEIDDIDRSVYEAIVRPWFSEPWSLKMVLGSGTPRRGRNGLLYHLHKLGLDPNEPRYRTRHATYRDAPETVDVNEVEDARKHSPPATFAREWECDFDSAEGLVYAFDESFHVRPPPDDTQFTRFVVGVDHGWADPGVFLLVGITGYGEDAKAWIIDERYQSETPNTEWDTIAREWAEQWGHPTMFCDPSRPDRIHDLRKAGADAQPANNSIPAGVARVADLLAIREDETGAQAARLYVHPKCKNTIREFKSYKRKPDPHAADRFTEQIAPGNDHAMDCCRYFSMGVFGAITGYSTRHEAPGA